MMKRNKSRFLYHGISTGAIRYKISLEATVCEYPLSSGMILADNLLVIFHIGKNILFVHSHFAFTDK